LVLSDNKKSSKKGRIIKKNFKKLFLIFYSFGRVGGEEKNFLSSTECKSNYTQLETIITKAVLFVKFLRKPAKAASLPNRPKTVKKEKDDNLITLFLEA
jgi:hypothetical protein